MNKTFFTGRTTKDIELRYTQEKNTAVAKFSLAVDSGFGDKKKTNFFNMVAFGKTAETLEKYVRKGTKILVECQANQNKYTDRNGNEVNTVQFTVNNFEFCESRNQNQNQNQNNQAQQPQGQLPPMPNNNDDFMTIPEGIENELPFI